MHKPLLLLAGWYSTLCSHQSFRLVARDGVCYVQRFLDFLSRCIICQAGEDISLFVSLEIFQFKMKSLASWDSLQGTVKRGHQCHYVISSVKSLSGSIVSGQIKKLCFQLQPHQQLLCDLREINLLGFYVLQKMRVMTHTSQSGLKTCRDETQRYPQVNAAKPGFVPSI